MERNLKPINHIEFLEFSDTIKCYLKKFPENVTLIATAKGVKLLQRKIETIEEGFLIDPSCF